MPVAATALYKPGETAPVGSYQPGDFILTHGTAWTSKLIRFGSRLRYRGDNAPYAKFSHSALIVSANGDLIEAQERGVRRNNLRSYAEHTYVVVHPTLQVFGVTPPGNAVRDADRIARANAVGYVTHQLGDRYGYLTCVCIGFGLLTGGTLTFGFDGNQICSGLVARAQERLGYEFPRNPAEIMPADLAWQFGVQPLPEW